MKTGELIRLHNCHSSLAEGQCNGVMDSVLAYCAGDLGLIPAVGKSKKSQYSDDFSWHKVVG